MSHTKGTVRLFFSVVFLALFFKLCIVDCMYVSGPSMAPLLRHGSYILEFKLAWGIPVPFTNTYLLRWGKPKTGDIVIYTWLDRYVIKRIAATENTPLVFTEKSGYSVKIGDRSVPLSESQYAHLRWANAVPQGMIFALGDNLSESRDSRDYGFVSLDSIRGKVLWK